jgi:hypothetical protein
MIFKNIHRNRLQQPNLTDDMILFYNIMFHCLSVIFFFFSDDKDNKILEKELIKLLESHLGDSVSESSVSSSIFHYMSYFCSHVPFYFI